MVTPLTTGLIKSFDIVYAFLFVSIIVYVALGRIKSLEEQQVIRAIAGVIVGFITLTSNIAIQTVKTMMPWFVILFIIIIFGLLTYQLFGIGEGTITEVLSGSEHGPTFHNWLLTIIIMIALGSLYSVISGQPSSIESDVINAPQQEGFFSSMISPEVLGVIAILLIGLFATFYITESSG